MGTSPGCSSSGTAAPTGLSTASAPAGNIPWALGVGLCSSLQSLLPSSSSSPPQGHCVAAPPSSLPSLSPTATFGAFWNLFPPSAPSLAEGLSCALWRGCWSCLDLAVSGLGHPHPLPTEGPADPQQGPNTLTLHCWHMSELSRSSSPRALEQP